MAKPRVYGLDRIKQRANPDQLERHWKRKQKRQRQRESTTRKPVAAQIVKEKEATE